MDDYKLIKQYKYIKQLLNYKRFIVSAIYIILISKYIELLKLSHTLNRLPFDKFHINKGLYIMVVISIAVYIIDVINLTLLKGRGIKMFEIVVIIVTILTFNLTIKSSVMNVATCAIGIIAIGVVLYRKNKVDRKIVQYKEQNTRGSAISIGIALLVVLTLSRVETFETVVILIGTLLYVLIRFANYSYNYDLYLKEVKYSEEELTVLLSQYEQKYGKLK